jgi:hypothetical protein
MPRNIINDGYTRTAHIAPVERIHEGSTFEFRPMLPAEVDAVTDGLKTHTAEEGSLLLAAAMVDHLADWDEVDKNGNKQEINLHNVSHLPPKLFNAMYNVISGFYAGDPLPRPTKQEDGEYVSKLLESAKTGKTPGRVVDQADQKNSSKG